MLAFGSQTTGSSIIATIVGSAPELLLGKMQGMTEVGLFSRANGLITMFQRLIMDGIGTVATPWFAKQSRDHGSIAQPFLKATSYVTAVGWAFVPGIAFLAHPAIRILYGDQWDNAVDLTRLLAGTLAVGMPTAMCVAALMALGAANQVLRNMAISGFFTVLLLAIGATFGLHAMGACLVVATVIRSWLWMRATQQEVGFHWSELFTELGRSAMVATASGIAPAAAFILYGPHPDNIWLPMAVGVPGAAIGFLAAVVIFKHPLLDELQGIRAKLGL